MFPISYGWFSIGFLCLSALYAFITDKRCRARDIVSFSILVQLTTTIIAYNKDFPVFYLAALSSALEAFFAYILWHERRYYLRKPYTALLMTTSTLTLLWGLDSWVGTGLLFSETEPSAFTFICSILTIIQGIILIVGARGKDGRGHNGASRLVRFISYFDSSFDKSDKK